jgi:signal transduction histidine kinase
MLQEAVRDALRGRGRSRREAAETVLARARTAPAEVVPLVLAVRDELAAEEAPPRGLAGRVDALLLAVAASSEEGIAKAERGERRAQRGRQASPSVRVGERAGRVLAQLLRVAPDPVLTIRASGRVGIWNAAGVTITGRRRRELREAGPRSLFQRSDDYDALLEDLERDGRVEPSETVLLSAGGAEVPVRVFAQRLELPTADGRDPDRYLLYLHDLTEVHRIRRRLIETEKLSAMAKIAGSVAHEFRNPLNSLFLSADLLEDELAGRDAGEAITPTLAAIREEVERLNQIINHYLALSKVESTDPVIVDLGETVQAFAEEWREKSAETPIEVRVKVYEGDVAVSADPNQVRRVLVNLIENAEAALTGSADDDGERTRSPTVTFDVRPMRRSVKLTVKDNGPGIPEEVRDRVFEPFFTSRSRGSGLGLYLVREIVLAHGGAIQLAQNGGRGTSVAMHWPRPETLDA